MRTKVFWIPGEWPGRLGIVERPRGGDWLHDEIRSWREAGIDFIVSLLEPAEEAELLLEEESRSAVDNGLSFRSFPIPDRGVPASREEVVRLAADIVDSLRAGKNVAVHCRQGIGRSAIIGAAVLTASGEQPANALATIQDARGVTVPETPEQRRWVTEFSSSLPTFLAAQPAAAGDRLRRRLSG